MTKKLPTPTPQSLPSSWKGFNLLNMFYVGGGHSDKPFEEEDFKIMSEWGFNFARIPMDYRILIKQNDWNIMDEKSVMRLDKAIEYGNKYNVHINLNLHRAPGFSVAQPAEKTNLWTDSEPQEAFAKMWAYFAKRYIDIQNEHLSFNFVNEPTQVSEDAYTAVIKKAADAIREIDPNRVLIADGLEYGQYPSNMIKELGIAQATRGYFPHTVSHFKANWVEGADKYPVPAWPDDPSSMNKNWLWESFVKPWVDLKNSGCGVMVGEWGCHNKTPHGVVLNWMEDNLQNFKEAGFGWALWNLNGSFGVFGSGREDIEYENIYGRKLDRKMLSLLMQYMV